MAIRILPENEIKQAASSFNHPVLLFSNPKNLYQRRAERLRTLAENHPLADYLLFAAQIVDAQLALLEEHPLANEPRLTDLTPEQLATQPLNAQHWQRDPIWREYLAELLNKVKLSADENVLPTIEWLEKAASSEIEDIADKLLAQEFGAITSDKAVFVWAALSLYWLQLVQQLPRNAKQESAEDLHYCPVCHSAPIASVVHFGATQGLRYLHCSLCESEWNMVRARCTNCDHEEKLDYWSIDNELAPVRAESCGNCNSYLKAMYQEKDPKVEPAADDLATIFLDVEMEDRNLMRSGVNPYLFPSE